MKIQSYKTKITFIAICFLGTAFAQKVEKKFTENFKVNKQVEISIEATNTDINVTTWNKNEVQINAFIEIEGLSKEEAEKYIKKWDFEALGNKKKVSITSKEGISHSFDDNFVFFNKNTFNFPEIEIIDIDSLKFPEMNFDFEMPDLDMILPEMDFDLDKLIGEEGNYNLEWNDGVRNIAIKSKKEWEAFKKTKEYKELQNDLKNNKEKFKKEWVESKEKIKKINKEDLKRQLEKAKIEFQKIDKEKIREDLEKATEALKKMKFNFFSESKNNDVIRNGKKIKIKKRLEIKVPKAAIFDLNTRHCKVNLPNTIASGKVSYGSFDASNLKGGELKINYCPVTIDELNGCTLFLNNVTDAKIASVTNTTLKSNSGNLSIDEVFTNVNLRCSFGQLKIAKLNKSLTNFKLDLKQSDASLPADLFVNNLKIYLNNQDSKMNEKNKKLNFNGNFRVETKNGTVKVNGKYSYLKLVK
jgi:hypothetical protein